MCLITKQKIALIAEEDITVWKIGSLAPGGWLNPPYNVFDYFENELYETNILVAEDFTFFSQKDNAIVCGIEGICTDTEFGNGLELRGKGYEGYGQGFHSITDKDFWLSTPHIDKLYEFVVPKGAEYYVNEDTKLMVSNQIMWTGR